MSGQADLDNIWRAIEKQTQAIEQQSRLLQRLIQIQESMLILMADDHDHDTEPQTYLSGRPAT
jgi:hypothetical protein